MFYPSLAVKQNVYVYPSRIRPDLVFVDVKTYHGRLYLERLRKTVGKGYVLVYSKNGVEVYKKVGVKFRLDREGD